MDVFIARQPILDKNKEVFGYELLYRDGAENYFEEKDGDYASSTVLTSCFIDFGINEVTSNRKAFINFTGDLLKNNVAFIFPKEYLVVEILENVKIDKDIIRCCKDLKEKGYALALDDFVYKESYEELMPLVDIIKVDFTISNEVERSEIVRRYSRKGLCFLAEKVETLEDYESAVNLGYTYFQGYYFARPEINAKKKVAPYKESHIQLMRAINSKEPEYRKIALIIENDLSFSYEILKIVNSAYYNRKNKIMSMRHALVTLGLSELKKWLYLTLMREVKHDKPEELINICMLRAKFMENIAIRSNKNGLSSEMMTLGMFSMIDILTGKTMEEITKEMNFSDSIKSILNSVVVEGFIAESFRIVLKYEKGQWEEVKELIEKLDIPISLLNESYMDAIKWMQEIRIGK